jgi:hypothetical protein
MIPKKYVRYSLYAITIIFILFIFNCNMGGNGGDCGDDYEPNDSCENAYDLGTFVINSAEKSWNATISSAGDVDWFCIFYEEEALVCNPGDPQPYLIQIRLLPPQNDCIDLNLYVYDDDCNLLLSSELNGCQEETIDIDVIGMCGIDDSDYLKIKIQAVSGDVESSENYTLYFSAQDN